MAQDNVLYCFAQSGNAYKVALYFALKRYNPAARRFQ